jgi:AcrR family transcriptional regulator
VRSSSAATVDAAGRQGAHVLEMQRRRLLLAITEVVAEEGLESAGVGRVCARAGVSRRTFYDLFGDGEACFLAAFERAVERLSGRAARACARERRWCERVRSALGSLLECLQEEPALARLCVVETLKGGPEVLAHRRRVIEQLIAAVDEGRGESKTGTAPSPLAAESTVGGVIAVIHARLLERDPRPLGELARPLMSMIVHPYLGAAAARRELGRPAGAHREGHGEGVHGRPGRERTAPDPFRDLPLRFTYRTARVLEAIAAHPGASNRQIGQAAGVSDQGQMSKLLARLERHGLIENRGSGHARGEANAWRPTARGESVRHALAVNGAAA